MEPVYCFHLGRERKLSVAELESHLGKPVEHVGAIAKMAFREDPQALLNQLGGITQISQVLIELETDKETWPDQIAQTLNQIRPEGKVHFGLNRIPQNDRELIQLLKLIKKSLKQRNRNGRFLNKNRNLNTATLVKGGLMKDRTALNVIQWKGKWLLTQTVAVQDFEQYSLRDYEKPARLAKSGMLPPKLAQLMINLTQGVTGPRDVTGKTLYDPFCGSGTVLGEGLIKGMSVIGSDLSPEAIKAAEQNTAWILKKNLAPQSPIHIFHHDAQTLTPEALPHPPDMIVSETYLGPPCHDKMPLNEIQHIQSELLPLYQNTYRQIHPLLKPGTPIVMAFPLHHSKGKAHPLPHLHDTLRQEGFRLHRSLTYHRKNQAVGREILILERI